MDKIIVTFDPLAFLFFWVGLLRNQNETWDFFSVSIYYLILAAWKKIIREILPLDVSENRGVPPNHPFNSVSIINHPFWGVFPLFLSNFHWISLDGCYHMSPAKKPPTPRNSLYPRCPVASYIFYATGRGIWWKCCENGIASTGFLATK